MRLSPIGEKKKKIVQMQKYKLLFHWTKTRGKKTVLANNIAC